MKLSQLRLCIEVKLIDKPILDKTKREPIRIEKIQLPDGFFTFETENYIIKNAKVLTFRGNIIWIEYESADLK